MRLSSFGPALFVSVLLFATGCADRTAILVEVTSTDLTIPTDVDAITIRAASAFGATFEETYPVSASWPHSLTITPPPQEGIGAVRIDVTGSLGGSFVVRRVVGTEFVPGETRRVSVVLTRTCVAVMCADGYDCVNGRCCLGAACVDTDAGMGDSGMPDDAGFDAGSDAGELDTGMMTVDSGIDAPMSMMDSGMDAGRDAGMDAGRDAGRDAGSDAGTDAPLPAGARLVINEIDYNQSGTDVAEWVEIYNAGSADAPLAGLAVLLIDGSAGTEYGRAVLSGTLPSTGYLIVGISGQTLSLPGGVARFDVTGTTSIQNTNDGVALVNLTAMTILDRLSYGMPPVTVATIFGMPTTLVEGTAFTSSDTDVMGRSLCRRPNGADTDNAASDFMLCTGTIGAAN